MNSRGQILQSSTFRVLAAALALTAALPAGAAAQLPAGRPLTIAWGGDTTLGSSYGNPPDDGFAALSGVARLLSAADSSAVNAEGTFGSGGSSKCGGGQSSTCFAFQAPAQNAGALRRAGVDIANLANNHAFDFGATGMGETVRALSARKVAVTGRPGEITVLSVPGARIAFVGFASYRWSAPLNDHAAVRALCREASKRANVVVAFFHGGAEGADRTHVPRGNEHFLGEDRGDLRTFARAAIDGGADLVLGSGPHVLRGMERYHKRLIAYSLGNLAGFHNFATGGVLSRSGILRATIASRGELMGGRFESLALDATGIPHVDTTGASGQMVSQLSREDFGASAVTVAADGTLSFAGAAPA
jgi:poly-gamma-glutamate capsule biosynthesis protein CapA/YwtB (metallophosphatase superfamily)